jgi:formate/nitrite transporter FocA (FNT family)
MMVDLLFVGTLLALLYAMVVAYVRMPSASARLVLVSVVTCVAVALTLIAYPSEPRQWHVSNLVVFMVDEVFHIFAIIGNILTGALLFALVSSCLYLLRRRDSRDARADLEL